MSMGAICLVSYVIVDEFFDIAHDLCVSFMSVACHVVDAWSSMLLEYSRRLRQEYKRACEKAFDPFNLSNISYDCPATMVLYGTEK